MAKNRGTDFPVEVHANAGQPLGMPPARFLRDYWQKRPLLVRNAFPDFTPPLSADELAGLACMDGALARIVRKRQMSSRPGNRRDAAPGTGKMDPGFRRDDVKRKTGTASRDDCWEVRTGPFDDATFAKLPESDWTLLVQDVDKWDADTAALLDHFAFIPTWRIDDVMISYATDGGGVGAHVDQYDVFLLQGLGRRRWAIDTRRHPPTAFRDDVELKLLKAFSPDREWILEPGDMLYLPPGVPHDGVAVGECMTFSIGMRAPSAAEMLVDFAQALAERSPDEVRYRDPDLRPARVTGEIDDAAFERAARALPRLRRTGRADAGAHHTAGTGDAIAESPMFRTWFGSFITSHRAAQAPKPRRRPIDRAGLARRLPHATIARDPWSRFAWCRNGRHATLFVSGTTFDAPLAWARALSGRSRELAGAHLARLPQLVRGMALLAKLIDAGHLRVDRR